MTEPDTTRAGYHDVRGGDGLWIRTPETAHRDARACELRRDGHTFDSIALTLGYAHRSEARKAVQRGLLAIVQEPAEELRSLELERLDMLWAKTMEVLMRKHVTVQHGKVVLQYVDEDGPGIPVVDDEPVLKAVGMLIKIQERRAKLVGLDSPAKIELLTVDLIDAEIQRLRQSMDMTVEEQTRRLAAEHGLPYPQVEG